MEDHYPCDGTSLMPLIEGAETEDREVIVEAHEAVGTPCVMIRKNNYKYNHIHGHEAQLLTSTRTRANGIISAASQTTRKSKPIFARASSTTMTSTP